MSDTNCKNLWTAVLARAVADATGGPVKPNTNNRNPNLRRDQAITWLLGEKSDQRLFNSAQSVCELVGVDRAKLLRKLGLRGEEGMINETEA